MNAALAGLLVADLTQNVAGPYCTQILGDMGAEVVKVERLGPRRRRARVGAALLGPRERHLHERQPQQAEPRGRPQGAEGARGAASGSLARADVFVQSLRAGRRRRSWASAAPRLAALNPRLVYCSITAFGTEGPLADRPGYDPLMQAYGGIMSINGHPGQPPARVPVSIVDMGTGMWAVIGILAALRERDRTGRGGAGDHRALRHRARVDRSFQMSELPRRPARSRSRRARAPR